MCIGTYTDQEYDAATGLYNYNARLYDPAVGTFISPDSIVPNVYDPQSLNRFAYARNNPLKYNDPDGHAFVLAIPLGIAAFEYAASTTLGVTVGIVVGAWLSDVLFNEEQENKPYSDRRPYTRKPTLKDAWDKADDGEQEDTKSCPDCGKDVKGNPHEGEPRKGEDGWDLDHIEKWGDIRDGLDTQNVPPSDYRDAYNDTNNTRLRCPSCNRSDNRLSNNNEASGVGSEGEIDSSVDLGYW